jgi:hypothetical protein
LSARTGRPTKSSSAARFQWCGQTHQKQPQQSSLPGHLQWFYFFIVNGSRQKHLPHDIPLWVVSSREIYFITINCRERFHNQLTLPAVAEKLFETVRHRQEKFLWWPCFFC